MSWAGMPWCKLAMVLIDKIVTKVEKITLSWQFCWCPFWDGENVTLSGQELNHLVEIDCRTQNSSISCWILDIHGIDFGSPKD